MTQTNQASQTRYDRKHLPDHASEKDERQLPIDQVGIEGLSYPIQILDKTSEYQSTVAEISLSVGLPAEFKGTHMSRFIEVLNAVRGEMTVRNLPKILSRIQEHLEANEAFIKLDFPYFISKKAPVSKVESLMEYRCGFEAARRGSHFDFVLHVSVPVTTLCPCSKAISDYGAHNQRSTVHVQLRASDFVWIEDVIDKVEACASAPVYALLKREDEKFVTEQAYDNPRFVEDLLREITLNLRQLDGVTWIRVHASNQESIHNHAAYGVLEWQGSSDSAPRETAEKASDDAPALPSFGEWLRGLRMSRNYGQEELSSLLGVSASYLSRLEGDARSPSREFSARVAEVFAVSGEEAELRAGFVPQSQLPQLLEALQQG